MSSNLLFVVALLAANSVVDVAGACCEGIIANCEPCLHGECAYKDFVKCRTCCKDHIECCIKQGVTGLCLDLCDGTKDITYNDMLKYAGCSGQRFSIVKCWQP